MSLAFTADELKNIISTLKDAYIRAAASGGVTSYTLESGQGKTTVTQASLEQIRLQLNEFQSLLQEVENQQNGSSFTFIRDLVY